MRNLTLCSGFVVVCLLAVSRPAAATLYETNDTQRATLAIVDNEYAQNVAKFADSPDYFVRRGLVANKKSRQVRVLAEACNIADGATVEFPIIGELSDRDYEAMFRSFAKPGDIATALEFIGVPRGRNVCISDMRFWAKGERVSISVAGLEESRCRPIQSYMIDKVIGSAPAWSSFVYCGSPDDAVATNGVRLADTTAPNSILATYNEPQTVLDLPEISNQSDVYERYVLDKKSGFTPFKPYLLVFNPEVERADGKPRVQDMTLKLSAVSDGAVAFALSCNGAVSNFCDAATLFKAFKASAADGFDLHVTLDFDDSLTLRQARALAQAIVKIEGDKGIRIEQPNADGIYYKGFLPTEEWRFAKTRVSQPWEVHFTTNAIPVRLVQTFEDWSDPNSLDPVLTTKEFNVADAAAATETITKAGDGLPVLLVYASASAKLSSFMPTIRMLKGKHPTVYVFCE